jgi:hypothetical protein
MTQLRGDEPILGLNSLEQRRTSSRNSYDGGDKDPTKKIMEESHTIHTSIKIKIET